SPQAATKLASDISLPSYIPKRDGGMRKTSTNDINEFLPELEAILGFPIGYRGQGVHVTDLNAYEASNWPVGPDGRYSAGTNMKRSQNQGVHQVPRLYEAPGRERPRWMMP